MYIKRRFNETNSWYIKTGKFDYILIEASGICEPLPIAQTITILSENATTRDGQKICRLDNVVTVVDSLRLATEFGSGDDLVKEDIDEEDIENLLIQQIEFCNTIVLNKVNDIEPNELNKVKAIIKQLQPKAKIIEANYGKVSVKEIIDTNNFDFEEVANSAGWIKEIERSDNEDIEEDDEHHHEHEDHHEHHHHHDEGEAEEYGISTFVYTSRKPMDEAKFHEFVKKIPRSVIRCKGLVWFSVDNDMSYLFEQAGRSVSLSEAGYWLATAPKEELEQMVKENPEMLIDWDEEVGDRMTKLVFIGKDMDKEAIKQELRNCE